MPSRPPVARPRRVPLAVLLLAVGLVLGAAGLTAAAFPGAARAAGSGTGRPMPEFTNRSPAVWINSPPLARADLRGKVVLIEVWTSI